MNIWESIKKLFTKKENTKLLSESTSTNYTATKKQDFASKLKSQSEENLTQEQLKEKFIKEKLGISLEIVRNPVALEAIMEQLEGELPEEIDINSFDEYSKLVSAIKIEENNYIITGTKKKEVLQVCLDENTLITEKETWETGKFHEAGTKSSYEKRIYDTVTNLEMMRVYSFGKHLGDGKVAFEPKSKVYKRNPKNLTKGARYNIEDRESDQTEIIEKSIQHRDLCIGQYDIASLDALDMSHNTYDVEKTLHDAAIQSSATEMLNSYTNDIINKQSEVHIQKLREKNEAITQSRIFDEDDNELEKRIKEIEEKYKSEEYTPEQYEKDRQNAEQVALQIKIKDAVKEKIMASKYSSTISKAPGLAQYFEESEHEIGE